ncbi:universal stress protein [Actinophytocola sp. KF-1]
MSDPMTSATRKRPVLAGFDGSATARTAVMWAAAEAARRGAELLVARAYERPIDITDLSWTPVGLRDRWPRSTHCDNAVRELAADCAAAHPDLAVSTTIRAGHPSDVLGELAEETDAALVVLGAAEHGPVARFVLGSVAADMVHRVARPLVAVRHAPTTAADAPVVLGLAGTAADEPAVGFAFDVAARLRAPLHAIHSSHQRDSVVHAERLLAPWRERYAGVPVRTDVLADKPAQALVDRSAGARLLVVGCHHHGALHRALLGSVSHTSLHHAGCPVAVVPSARHRAPRHATTAAVASG